MRLARTTELLYRALASLAEVQQHRITCRQGAHPCPRVGDGFPWFRFPRADGAPGLMPDAGRAAAGRAAALDPGGVLAGDARVELSQALTALQPGGVPGSEELTASHPAPPWVMAKPESASPLIRSSRVNVTPSPSRVPTGISLARGSVGMATNWQLVHRQTSPAAAPYWTYQASSVSRSHWAGSNSSSPGWL